MVQEHQGETYYLNTITGETSWEVPEDLTYYDGIAAATGTGPVVDAAWQEDTTGYEWNDATQTWEVAQDWDPSEQPEWNAMASQNIGASYGGVSGYDASTDGAEGPLETGYFGEDGMWYEESGGAGGGDDQTGYYAEDGVWHDASSAGYYGDQQAGYYGDDQQWHTYDSVEGGTSQEEEKQYYATEDGQWYQADPSSEGAGEDYAQQEGYIGDDGQWYAYDGNDVYAYDADQNQGSTREVTSGGPGYVVVTILKARGLRKASDYIITTILTERDLLLCSSLEVFPYLWFDGCYIIAHLAAPHFFVHARNSVPAHVLSTSMPAHVLSTSMRNSSN